MSRTLKESLELAERSLSGDTSEKLPCETDEKVIEVTKRFREGTVDQRDQIRNRFNRKHSFPLLHFAERMAVLTVRRDEIKWAKEGLTAIAIENFCLDWREDMLIIPLLDNSIRKIGEDPDPVFEEVAQLAEPDVSETLLSFAQAEGRLKTIEQMGYEEVTGPDGFDYERNW